MDVLVYFLMCSDILFCECRPLIQTGLDARCALFLYARGVLRGHAWRGLVGAVREGCMWNNFGIGQCLLGTHEKVYIVYSYFWIQRHALVFWSQSFHFFETFA